jgi:hypothetical protein
MMMSLVVISADPDAKSKVEIDHILEFIKNSDVIFIRNGKEYPVADGLKHIQKKYDHFKSKIITCEDFIEKSATKSEMSGDAYQVKLKDNTKIDCAKWLLMELKIFRENQTKNEKPKE